VNTTNLPQLTMLDKGTIAPPLSSGAYFDTSTNVENRGTPFGTFRRGHEYYQAMRRSNRVQRGNASQMQWRVDVHADMLRIRRPRELTGLPKPEGAGGGLRGTVTGFSRASRKRMIEFMASVRNTGSMLFLTMTYDDMAWLTHWGTHHDHFEAFRRRFERKYPNWRCVWRVEFQERKSGILIGNKVPHFHLLVFMDGDYEQKAHEAQTQLFSEWGADAWQEITQSTDANHLTYGFHVTPVRNRKHAYSYVSKYVAKAESDDINSGRRWGRIGRFDTSSSETIQLSEDENIILRRLVRRWLKNRSKQFAQKFSKYGIGTGYSVFGIGDTSSKNGCHDIFAGFAQFIVETKRQSAELNGCQYRWDS